MRVMTPARHSSLGCWFTSTIRIGSSNEICCVECEAHLLALRLRPRRSITLE